jgi:hypothetical protein
VGLLLDFQLIIAGVGGVSPKCSFFDCFVADCIGIDSDACEFWQNVSGMIR